MNPDPLDRLGDDGFVAERMTFYAALYPKLREVAKTCGYALALHGSLVKDLDLVAVPWIEEAKPPDELLKTLTEAANGFIPPQSQVIVRPHGRRAAVIYLGSTGGYIDLSIMPTSSEASSPQ